MREIKFDVILWDGKDPTTIRHYNIGEALREGFVDYDGDCLAPCDDAVIIRQYTGLKDKQGKEIYEGDILKVEEGYDGDYYKEGGDFICKWHLDGWVVFDNKGEYIYDLWGAVYHRNAEVIGNIYEGLTSTAK